MKKIFFIVAMATAMASCQKMDHFAPKSAIVSNPDADDVPLKFRQAQQHVMDSLESRSNSGLSTPTASAWNITITCIPDVPVITGFDDKGRFFAKYVIPVVVISDKRCYLPWKFSFLHGADDTNIPSPYPDTFSNQIVFKDQLGHYVDGYNDLPGQLVRQAYRGNTAQVYGAYRVNGPQSETWLKPNKAARLDIVVVLMEGEASISPWSVAGTYAFRLTQMYAKQNATDGPSLWRPLITNTVPGETPYTVSSENLPEQPFLDER